jgi:hypothetical protein
VSPVWLELCSYIPEDDILHSDRRATVKSYMGSNCLLLIRMVSNSVRAVGAGMGGVLRDVERQ